MCVLMKEERVKQGGGGPEKTETQEEAHTRIEAETGVLQQQARECKDGRPPWKLRARTEPPLQVSGIQTYKSLILNFWFPEQ